MTCIRPRRRAVAATAEPVTVQPGTGTAADPIRATLPVALLGTTIDGDAAPPCGGGGRTRTVCLELDRDATAVTVSIVAGTGCRATGTPTAPAVAGVGPGVVDLVITSTATATDGEFLLAARGRRATSSRCVPSRTRRR